jgi:hypothetical protein
LKSSATGTHQRTQTEGGKRVVVPRLQLRGVRGASLSKCTTWHSACTPASVRPAQITSTGAAATEDNASSSVACTVGSPGWPCGLSRCQPRKSPPSYSTPNA